MYHIYYCIVFVLLCFLFSLSVLFIVYAVSLLVKCLIAATCVLRGDISHLELLCML
jgi:hypothetical protein